MGQVAAFLGGMALGAIGLLLSGVGAIGILDPVGTKMADDADPFGPIGAKDYFISSILLVIGLLLIVGAGYIFVRVDKKS